MFTGRKEPTEDVGFPEAKTGWINVSEDFDLILGRCRGLNHIRRCLEIPCTVILDPFNQLAGEVPGQAQLLDAFAEHIDTRGADLTTRVGSVEK